jgi:hypothetical protein
MGKLTANLDVMFGGSSTRTMWLARQKSLTSVAKRVEC